MRLALAITVASALGGSGGDTPTCAELCMYTAARLCGVSCTLNEVQMTMGSGMDGQHSFAELISAARSLGLSAVPMHATKETADVLPVPFIAHTRLLDFGSARTKGHYLVVLRMTEREVVVLDPPSFPYTMTWQEFDRLWSGNCLCLAGDENGAKGIQRAVSGNGRDEFAMTVSLVALIAVMTLYLLFSGVRSARAMLIDMGSAMVRVPRRAYITGAFAAVCVSGGLCYRFSGAAPKLGLDRTLSLGVIPSGRTERMIEIRNMGNANLEVKGVRSSCKCAVLDAPPPIGPGKSEAMHAAFNINPGPGGARLLIHSNDPLSPHFVAITWIGRGAQPRISTNRISATVPEGSVYKQTVSVVVAGDDDAELSVKELRVVGNDKGIQLTLAAKTVERVANALNLTNGALLRQPIDVIVNPSGARVRDVCRIVTEYAGETYSFDVPIAVNFQTDVLAQPEKVLFSGVTGDDVGKVERVVSVRHPSVGGAELSVAQVPDWATCRLTRVNERETTAKIGIKTVPKSGVGHGEVELKWVGTSRAPVVIDVLLVRRGALEE